jgi:hypothetical protein
MSNPETVDITNVVEKLRETFVTWAVGYIYGLEVGIPGMGWVALPILSSLDKAAIKEILNILTRSAVMEAFFLNTAVRKADQARDYVDAVTAKLSLPNTATQEEYKNAENAEMDAFRNFVSFTN